MMSKNTFRLFIAAIAASMALGVEAQSAVDISVDNSNVSLSWYGDNIVRVVKVPANSTYNANSMAVTAEPVDVKAKVTDRGDSTIIKANDLRIAVSNRDGVVSFATAKGVPVLLEASPADFVARDDAGKASWQVSQAYRMQPNEDIYGLGILQNGKMSQRGENRQLRPGNTEDGIPFFQSNYGYGMYWDNYSPITISDDSDILTMTSEVGDAVDYYFIYGGTPDGVIAGVRHLTGDVPMLPLWAFGFMQSRERYKSQDELLDVLHRYRADGVPIDCMIQDWQYWGNNYLWNAMEFMSETFPDPQAMIDDVHANNAKCMISIWSSFGPMTKPYKQLDEKGLLFDMSTWPQSGISHIWPPRMDYPSGVRVYNPYSAEARDIYWDNLRRIYDLGMDAWWMDSTEPDHFDWTEDDFNRQTGIGSYRSVLGAFPLNTVGGVYDHQRAASDSARVMILTRSGSFGQQRYGANVWSGDVVSTWDMLRRQIPAGLNFSLTGNPNFNSDLGGFFAGSYNGSWRGKRAYDNPAFRELYARWTQMGVFTPMMRSHGADTPRELYYYGTAGEPVYDALLGAIKLRYSLLPYIYSTAWDVSNNRGTYMRALMMDFPGDAKAAASNNSYMFGPALLATPIINPQYTPETYRRDADANAGWDKNVGRTSFESMSDVDFSQPSQLTAYLPQGTDWYYYHTGDKYQGGQDVQLQIDFTEVPFFVRAGSILPIGPDVQYSSEKPWDNLTLKVYPGANGHFTLYEDAGDGYAYEQGEYTTIPMTWNDKKRTLTIGARSGSYPGMLETRTFDIVLPDGTTRHVPYNGRKLNVAL